MKRAKKYPTTIRRWYRPAEHECPVCHRTLRQAMTLSRRTVVTFQAVIKLIHAGYRCPGPQCLGRSRIYRSVEADALALTGRRLVAENVLSSETEVMKALLAPVTKLGVKVLGSITDAQESEVRAVEQLRPDVPHQVCQFHILREASRPGFEVDRKLKTVLRKRLG